MATTEALATRCLWIPWTLRTPTLSALIIISLLLVACIEMLAQKGAKEGGLSLSESIDSIPQISFLASSYLPTFLALSYCLIWSWVDLDSKRIQPWLELSKEGGSTAQSSLFLDYSSEFLAFTPFRAARRRHWLVFYTGTIVVIVSWLITPLQSSIFGVGPIRLTRQAFVSAPASLVPIPDQASLLDVEILNDAFAITWLGRDFPFSMTADYALLPFESKSAIPPFATSVYLKSWTWQLTTDLNCWPATVNGSNHFFHVNNGQGCEVELGFFSTTSWLLDTQYSMLYVGYYRNDWLDYYLEGPSCSKNASHQFLAISAARNSTADPWEWNYMSITAIFCQPQYSKRNVSVILSKDTLMPVEGSIVPNGNNAALLESEFNITAFEYLLGTGRPPVNLVRDYPKQQTLEQYPQLVGNRIEWPNTNIIGFTIGSQNYSDAELHNPSALAAAHTMAHRTLFSTTISHLLSNTSDVSPVPQGGLIQYTTYGVIVSRPISAVVEALLLIVATLAGCALYHYQDHSDDATLREHLRGNSYFLREKNEAGRITLCLDKSQNIRPRTPQQNSSCSLERDYEPIQPSALSPVAGKGIIGFLLIGVAALLYLKQQQSNSGGLTPPSSNFEVRQLLENYIPTVFAMLLEPFWIMLNRMYCVFQPFSELQKGRSLPQHSVLAKYTSMPPQLAVWRSAKAHQYLLMFICLATLLANILALSLSGLFNDTPRVVTYKTMVKPTRIAAPSRNDILMHNRIPGLYQDHFQALMANLSSKTRLPLWTDNTNFYLPFGQPRDRSLARGDQLKATTLGFGIESQCSPIHSNDSFGGPAAKLSLTNTKVAIAFSARLPNGSNVQCSFEEFAPPWDSLFPGRPSAMELILGPWDLCWPEMPWVAGWLRVHQQESGNRTLRSVLLNCQSNLRAAMFDVTVDTDGNIIRAENLGDPGANLEHWPANLSQLVTASLNEINLYTPGFGRLWRNKTVTTDWINHLLTLMMGSRSIVDPSQEVPDSTTVRPILEDLQQRLAAVVFGLNPSFFQKAADNADLIPATIIRTETRIFLSETAFILSVFHFGFLYFHCRSCVCTRTRHPAP
ncbi:hypothetical protein NUW58_g1602 [Xylaria curta]|uniref:Uncharacterized protein n=1 Tax=Xylaria curta TaxID=42375 RepID=A0ACC1PM12_9PEZI|nr:hypothetical protein NUW58_g1602 [Xylaria curta]